MDIAAKNVHPPQGGCLLVPARAVDGRHWDWVERSRWISDGSDPAPTLTLDFGEPVDIGEINIWTGRNLGTTDIVRSFRVDVDDDGEWQQVAHVTGNAVNPAVLVFPDEVTTERLRLRLPAGFQRIYNIEVYSAAESSPVGASLSAEPFFIPHSGDTVELSATLINRTGEPASAVATVTAPTDWTVEPSRHSYTLDPHGQQDVSYTVTSPPDAPQPAQFEVTLHTAPGDAGGTISLWTRDGIVYNGDGAPYYTETGTWGTSGVRPGHNDTQTRVRTTPTPCTSSSWMIHAPR